MVEYWSGWSGVSGKSLSEAAVVDDAPGCCHDGTAVMMSGMAMEEYPGCCCDNGDTGVTLMFDVASDLLFVSRSISESLN